MITILRTAATHLAAFTAGVLLVLTSLTASAPYGPAAVCHFDGGGTSTAGSVTVTGDGRPWLCTDDGYLIPWHG